MSENIKPFDVLKILNKKVSDHVKLTINKFEHTNGWILVADIIDKSKTIHTVFWLGNANTHHVEYNERMTMVFDPNFSVLSKILLYPNGIHMAETLKYEVDQKHAFLKLKAVYEFLTVKNKKQAEKLFNKSHNIGVKNSLITIFNLDVRNPYKRFFIFGNDEIQPQYKNSNFKIKNGSKIQIRDESALCFEIDGKKNIDMDLGTYHRDNNYLYVGLKVKYKKIKPSSKIANKIVRKKYQEDDQFYKIVKPSKKEIEEQTTKKIPCRSINGKVFNVKIKKGIISFIDPKTQEEYSVSHCDLGVDLLS